MKLALKRVTKTREQGAAEARAADNLGGTTARLNKQGCFGVQKEIESMWMESIMKTSCASNHIT